MLASFVRALLPIHLFSKHLWAQGICWEDGGQSDVSNGVSPWRGRVGDWQGSKHFLWDRRYWSLREGAVFAGAFGGRSQEVTQNQAWNNGHLSGQAGLSSRSETSSLMWAPYWGMRRSGEGPGFKPSPTRNKVMVYYAGSKLLGPQTKGWW